MNIASQEGCLKPTSQGVNYHTERDQKARGVDVHASQRIYNSWATQQKHSSYNYICHEAEHKKYHVSCGAPPVSTYTDINIMIILPDSQIY